MFAQAWARGTKTIRVTVKGARGSLLLQSQKKPSEFLAIARWDSLEDWRAFRRGAPPDPEAFRIAAAVSELQSVEAFHEVRDPGCCTLRKRVNSNRYSLTAWLVPLGSLERGGGRDGDGTELSSCHARSPARPTHGPLSWLSTAGRQKMNDYGHPLEFGVSVNPTTITLPLARRIAQRADALGLNLIGVQDHPYQQRFLDT